MGRLWFLIVAWYLLAIPSYSIYRILPIVQMGERSSSLYFLIVDILASLTSVFWISILIPRNGRRKRFSVWWLLFGLLLVYPMFMVYITYTDLTQKLCKKWNEQACIQFILPPNLRSLRLTWEK